VWDGTLGGGYLGGKQSNGGGEQRQGWGGQGMAAGGQHRAADIPRGLRSLAPAGCCSCTRLLSAGPSSTCKPMHRRWAKLLPSTAARPNRASVLAPVGSDGAVRQTAAEPCFPPCSKIHTPRSRQRCPAAPPRREHPKTCSRTAAAAAAQLARCSRCMAHITHSWALSASGESILRHCICCECCSCCGSRSRQPCGRQHGAGAPARCRRSPAGQELLDAKDVSELQEALKVGVQVGGVGDVAAELAEAVEPAGKAVAAAQGGQYKPAARTRTKGDAVLRVHAWPGD
jgi:hypothetical protein